MKKVIFCAVALMFSAVGISQVTDSNGIASPPATTVPIIGGAAGTANSGLSIQNGNSHKVKVRQAGTNQSVYTSQDDGSTVGPTAGANQAYVRQTGAVQPGISGELNRANVYQSGSVNSSITLQEGDLNDAVTRQGQDNAASSGNKAKIHQGTGQQAEKNYAGIDQDGADNQAFTQQTYDNSDAWTQQTGEGNKSKVMQNAGPNGSEGHYAMNEQEGDFNESSIAQRGAGARNSARALQIGNSNQAMQDQTATDAAGGTGNDAGISQGNWIGRADNVAPEAKTQWNTINTNINPPQAVIGWSSFTSQFNKAKQTQVGVDNSAGIIQMGGDALLASNYGEQDQLGSGNDAGMFQGHRYLGEASNYAKQEQEGADNTAGLAQTGSGNMSYQYQDGDDNVSLAYQAGKDHKLNTHQLGNQNVAYANQHGVDNRALIVQHDGQSYTVEQNAGLHWEDHSAGGNQADILQMGPDGDFGAGAIPCDFDAPDSLDMDYTVPGLNLGDICEGC